MNAIQDEQARRLREARAAAGYQNPTDAARAMGAQIPTYLGHENASRGFKASAGRYADFFRVSLEWLLLGRGPMRRREIGTVLENSSSKIGEELLTERVINIHQLPRDIPILGSGSCGEDGLFELNGQSHGFARRPPRLTGIREAYALYVQGDSMWPWRKPGQLVYVDPHQPPNIGDFVVVELKPTGEGQPRAAYIKQLVRRTARELRLHQFKPDEDLSLPMAKVLSVHRVIDWDELLGL